MSIKVTHKNRDYILDYTRSAVRRMEQMGFDVDKIQSKPMTMIPLLVSGAFVHNHSNLKPAKIDEIYDGIKNKNGFIMKLVELYYETISTLVDDGEEDSEGNENWEEI